MTSALLETALSIFRRCHEVSARTVAQRGARLAHGQVVAMTEVARRDPERWGLDDMPLLVAEARASGDQPLEAEVLRRYGFAVPTDAALDAIVACSTRGVLELGAGTGHWAALLARRGLDVVAYDVAPPPSPANAWFAGVQPWHHVHPGDERVVEECAERSLLSSGRRGTRRGRLTRSTGTTRPAATTSSSSVRVRAGARATAASTPDSARPTACIACTYGVADTACTCGIDAHWTRTSRTALPEWHGAETALHVYEPAHAEERRSSRRRRRRHR